MKKIPRSTWPFAALAILGIVACDAAPPSEGVVSEPVETELPAAETLNDLVVEALTDIYRDEDIYSRARRLATLLPTLGPDAVPAVKSVLSDLKLDSRGTELELLLHFWATHQGEEATRWAKEASPPGYREVAVFAALETWAEADPRAAVDVTWEWTADAPIFERIIPIAVVRGWYGVDDPPELRRFIADLPAGVIRQRAIAAYIRTGVEVQGAESVIRWAESIPDDERVYKLALFRRLADLLSQIDIAAGVRLCDAHCLGPFGDNMRSLIARNWVLDDGPAAMEWLSTAPPGYERNLAVRATFGLWARTDREAATKWLESQAVGEPGAWLAPAYPAYARLIAADAPTDAIRWAERITNENEREIVLIKVARVWRYLDEAAAEAWLAQSTLSEAARKKVREEPQGPGEPNG